MLYSSYTFCKMNSFYSWRNDRIFFYVVKHLGKKKKKLGPKLYYCIKVIRCLNETFDMNWIQPQAALSMVSSCSSRVLMFGSVKFSCIRLSNSSLSEVFSNSGCLRSSEVNYGDETHRHKHNNAYELLDRKTVLNSLILFLEHTKMSVAKLFIWKPLRILLLDTLNLGEVMWSVN